MIFSQTDRAKLDSFYARIEHLQGICLETFKRSASIEQHLANQAALLASLENRLMEAHDFSKVCEHLTRTEHNIASLQVSVAALNANFKATASLEHLSTLTDLLREIAKSQRILLAALNSTDASAKAAERNIYAMREAAEMMLSGRKPPKPKRSRRHAARS